MKSSVISKECTGDIITFAQPNNTPIADPLRVLPCFENGEISVNPSNFNIDSSDYESHNDTITPQHDDEVTLDDNEVVDDGESTMRRRSSRNHMPKYSNSEWVLISSDFDQ